MPAGRHGATTANPSPALRGERSEWGTQKMKSRCSLRGLRSGWHVLGVRGVGSRVTGEVPGLALRPSKTCGCARDWPLGQGYEMEQTMSTSDTSREQCN